MLKVILSTCSLLLLFSACSTQVKPPRKPKASQKTFEQEDFLIFMALRAEELKDYKASSKLFNELYQKSKKKEYLYRCLQNNLAIPNFKKVIQEVDKELKKDENNYLLIRIKILALVGLEEFEKARLLAIELVNKTHKPDDYILVSEIYVKQKKFNTAVKYLESAYTQNYNEKILDKMSIVLYVNLQRKKDAIAQLETHSRMHGCSKIICARLIGFYSNENNIDGLLSTYLKYYNTYPNKKVAQKIIQIYTYKKDYVRLMSFLKKSKSDNKQLLELYINSKNYKKAYPLAYKLYKETGEIDYLGQSAIFEYECIKDKKNKTIQKKIINKLEEVLKVKQDSLYLNYLGYLLIDHNINVKKGIKYVKKALVLEPNSIYYLDSLAWGYYKLGQCKKAKKIMKKVISLDGDSDDEVISHINAINKCIKLKKAGKKKK